MTIVVSRPIVLQGTVYNIYPVYSTSLLNIPFVYRPRPNKMVTNKFTTKYKIALHIRAACCLQSIVIVYRNYATKV